MIDFVKFVSFKILETFIVKNNLRGVATKHEHERIYIAKAAPDDDFIVTLKWSHNMASHNQDQKK